MDVYGVDAAPGTLDELIRTGTDPIVVDPPATLLKDVVDAARANGSETVRLLLSSTATDGVEEDFLLETTVAEARSRDRLAVRVASSPLEDRLVVTADDARVLVPVEWTVGLFDVREDDLHAALSEKYEAHWDDGAELSTRAPPRTSLFEAAADRLSESFVDDLDAALSGADRLEWYGTPTPVELSLVVAARSNEHLYDLSRWGEDAEFASRSSLSRSKNDLESAGVLAIRNDPQERGRPRQRLLVGDERLEDADAEELVALLRSLLDETS